MSQGGRADGQAAVGHQGSGEKLIFTNTVSHSISGKVRKKGQIFLRLSKPKLTNVFMDLSEVRNNKSDCKINDQLKNSIVFLKIIHADIL